MKTLQVGNIDTDGARFNGADLHQQLLKKGVKSQLCVRIKKTKDKKTWKIANLIGIRVLNFAIKQVEKILSIQSILYPSSLQLLFDKRFLEVDIVHYHLIHTGFFSILTLPKLSQMKPTVWTLHDPWAITGHCYHPVDCVKWKTGCEKCPYLHRWIPMLFDHTKFMWKTKKWVFDNSDIDVLVASKWMLNMAQQSPLLSNTRIHLIPFGIDLNVFHPMDTVKAKESLGIIPGSIVLAFRATNIEFKGLPYIKECIRKLRSEKPICLLTIDKKGLVDEFKGRCQIIDLGWLDIDKLPLFYNACDIFLMPSIAETFGVMAIEAMACGKPVIVFEGTSLPGVIFAPNGGIAVPKGDVEALRIALETLINDSQLRYEIGDSALKLAREHYDNEVFIDKIIQLYNEIIKRKSEHIN